MVIKGTVHRIDSANRREGGRLGVVSLGVVPRGICGRKHSRTAPLHQIALTFQNIQHKPTGEPESMQICQ